MESIIIVKSPTQATHALSELNPTARGKKNKWITKLLVRAPKTTTLPELRDYISKNGHATERDFHRERVKLASLAA
jgi:hypothetical protein